MTDVMMTLATNGIFKAMKGVCFTADTEILTMTGEVPIQYIEAGDIVWSMDMETGEIRPAKVTEAFHREASEIVTVTVAGEGIETTTEHPFWVADKGWIAAKDLSLDDKIVSYSGELLEVENISIVAAPTPVYNFEVEGTHTYYVSGANVLVHNMCARGAGDIEITKRMIETQEFIAKGRRIREVAGLVKQYGGKAKDWIKYKSFDEFGREVHWYFNKAVGYVKAKYK